MIYQNEHVIFLGFQEEFRFHVNLLGGINIEVPFSLTKCILYSILVCSSDVQNEISIK